GVAVEKKSDRLIMTTQVRAGWYRYIQKWVFHLNGTIDARFAFTTSNENLGATLSPHTHHAYYRFDFDIEGFPNDVIEYYDGKAWHPIKTEANQKRGATHQKWRVRDKKTNRGYEVIPGPHDGDGGNTTWAVADMWALHYHGNEQDDGGTGAGTPPNAAHLNKWLTKENIDGQDVVLWYRVGHRHDRDISCGTLGPTLRPFGSW